MKSINVCTLTGMGIHQRSGEQLFAQRMLTK